MALPPSGTISFSQLRTEYGGLSGQPIIISDYYRSLNNTGLVKHSVTTSSSAWIGPTGASTSNSWFQITIISGASSGYYQYMQAGGTNVGNTTSYTNGNSRWTTGGAVFYDVTTSNGAKTPTFTRVQKSALLYYAYTTTSTTTYYNAGVPTSGTISLSDFYNGANP